MTVNQQAGEVTGPTGVLTGTDLRRVRAVLYLNGVRGLNLDDATQDVQVRLLEQPAGSVDNVGAWACVVAARLAVDRHRRANTRTAVLERLRRHRATSHADPDVALRESVKRALAQLEPDLRAAMVLRYFADLSVPEIARMLDIPEGTVKSRLHRAAAALRPALQETR